LIENEHDDKDEICSHIGRNPWQGEAPSEPGWPVVPGSEARPTERKKARSIEGENITRAFACDIFGLWSRPNDAFAANDRPKQSEGRR
jgi:hypothetical protein